MSLRVEKIGWDDSFCFRQTSHALARSIAEGNPRVYIFSAFKDSSKQRTFSTTSHLIELAHACSNDAFDRADTLLQRLRAFHHEVISSADASTELIRHVDDRFDRLNALVKAWFSLPADGRSIPSEQNDYQLCVWDETISLLGLWEELAAELYALSLQDVGAQKMTGEVPKDAAHGEGEIDALRRYVALRAQELLRLGKTPIIPGYVGPFEGGILPRWGRGYSDVTASQVFQSLASYSESREFAIKKEFIVCSADPRVVQSVQKIRRLSFPNLLEMVGSRGALGKFVNPHALDPKMLSHGASLRIYSENDGEGTLITHKHAEGIRGIQFIQLKDVLSVTIESDFMHLPGYIETIGSFFRRHGIAIDNMISSQTVITITLNLSDVAHINTETLSQQLLTELRQFEGSEGMDTTQVEMSSLTELYIGGENFDRPGLMRTITDTLSTESINIETSAQPKNPRVMIIGIPTVDATRALRALHARLIEGV